MIGLILSATGTFIYALAYLGAAALFGALSYIFFGETFIGSRWTDPRQTFTCGVETLPR